MDFRVRPSHNIGTDEEQPGGLLIEFKRLNCRDVGWHRITKAAFNHPLTTEIG